MKQTLIAGLMVLFFLVAPTAENPRIVCAQTEGLFDVNMGTGWRCGNLLMQQGLQKLQVLANCGEPIATEKSWVDRYGEVDKLIYGPDAGYYYVLYFYVDSLIKVQEIRQ